jgi:hypothetical protein
MIITGTAYKKKIGKCLGIVKFNIFEGRKYGNSGS